MCGGSPPSSYVLTARQYIKRQCEIHESNYNKIGNVRVTLTLTRVSATTVAVDKQYYIFRVCVCVCACVPLVMQHAKNIRRIISSSATSPALQFSIFFINGMIFGKKVTEHKMCVLIFSTNFALHISHSKNN